MLGVAHTALGFALGGERDARWTLRRASPARAGAPFVCVGDVAGDGPGGDGGAGASGGCEARAARVLNAPAALARVDAWAERLARFFGADWLRVDVLAGNDELGWRVNEVTYPGHLQDVQPAWSR